MPADTEKLIMIQIVIVESKIVSDECIFKVSGKNIYLVNYFI